MIRLQCPVKTIHRFYESRTAVPWKTLFFVQLDDRLPTNHGRVMKMKGFAAIALLVLSNLFMTFAWYGHL